MKEVRWYVGMGLAVATSLLLLFSFPTFNVNAFGFIALIPVFFLTYTSRLKKALIYGILSGFLFYCLYLFWMNAYLAMVGVAFVTIVYGGYFAIALLLINVAGRAIPKYRVFLTAFIWIAVEYVKGFGFLGLTFGSIGYTQHNFLRFIQIADIGGEPLVSFIIVLFNAAVAHMCALIYERKMETIFRKGVLPLYISVGLILFSLIYGSVRLREPIPTSPSMRLSLIQSLSSPRTEWKEDKWNTLNRLINLTVESNDAYPEADLVVWTETAIRTSLRPNLIYGSAYHMRIQRMIKALNTSFIIGSPDNYILNREGEIPEDSLEKIYPMKGEEEVWTNSAYYLNGSGEIIDKYDKIQLTPFGEHFPLGKHLPFLQKILDKFTDSAGFTPGAEYTVFQSGQFKFGVVICWEGTYGYLIRRFIQNHADFIINISNDMWSQTDAGHFQHFTITKFRSIEHRIWFARAANDGVTAFINPHGQVVKILPIKEVGFISGEIGPKVRSTLYTRFGDVLPKIGLAVLIASFLFSLFLLVKKPSWMKKI